MEKKPLVLRRVLGTCVNYHWAENGAGLAINQKIAKLEAAIARDKQLLIEKDYRLSAEDYRQASVIAKAAKEMYQESFNMEIDNFFDIDRQIFHANNSYTYRELNKRLRREVEYDETGCRLNHLITILSDESEDFAIRFCKEMSKWLAGVSYYISEDTIEHSVLGFKQIAQQRTINLEINILATNLCSKLLAQRAQLNKKVILHFFKKRNVIELETLLSARKISLEEFVEAYISGNRTILEKVFQLPGSINKVLNANKNDLHDIIIKEILKSNHWKLYKMNFKKNIQAIFSGLY